MSSSRGHTLESQQEGTIDGEKEKLEVKFNMTGQIIANKSPFKARALELLKTHIGLIYDDWRKVPIDKKDDLIRQLQVCCFASFVQLWFFPFILFVDCLYLFILGRVQVPHRMEKSNIDSARESMENMEEEY